MALLIWAPVASGVYRSWPLAVALLVVALAVAAALIVHSALDFSARIAANGFLVAALLGSGLGGAAHAPGLRAPPRRRCWPSMPGVAGLKARARARYDAARAAWLGPILPGRDRRTDAAALLGLARDDLAAALRDHEYRAILDVAPNHPGATQALARFR